MAAIAVPSIENHRPILQHREYDDGVDRWRMTTVAPAPHLAGAITGYCHYTEHTTSFTTRREMPGTTAVMIVNIGSDITITGGNGAAITLRSGEGFAGGLHTLPAISQSSAGQQSGIHIFLPLTTLRRLLRLDMAELSDRVIDLRTLFGAQATTLGARLATAPETARSAIIDEALAPRLAAAEPLCRTTLWALNRLHNNPVIHIEALAAEIGWSRKHLANRIRLHTGATPRLYLRLRRFERLLANLAGNTTPHWADLAAAHGYADQPHLTREIRSLAGLTPSILQSRILPAGGGYREG